MNAEDREAERQWNELPFTADYLDRLAVEATRNGEFELVHRLINAAEEKR